MFKKTDDVGSAAWKLRQANGEYLESFAYGVAQDNGWSPRIDRFSSGGFVVSADIPKGTETARLELSLYYHRGLDLFLVSIRVKNCIDLLLGDAFLIHYGKRQAELSDEKGPAACAKECWTVRMGADLEAMMRRYDGVALLHRRPQLFKLPQ